DDQLLLFAGLEVDHAEYALCRFRDASPRARRGRLILLKSFKNCESSVYQSGTRRAWIGAWAGAEVEAAH
ncbi:MAG TPA: hypothetical protein VIY27_12485, partial [Myxococcota bacterium]